MPRASVLALLIATSACAPSAEITWLEGLSYRWVRFNHRLSHVHFDAESGGAVVIGGTSTTGKVTEFEGCTETCMEFPLLDEAELELRRGTVHTSKWATGEAELSVVAGAEGASVTVEVPLHRAARGVAHGILAGLTIDTDVPIEGDPTCYPPANGWHPTLLDVAVEDVILAEDGATASVTLRAAFAAGNSLEEERECVDAVNERARARISAKVLVLAGRGASVTDDVDHGWTYELGDRFEPIEQPAPAPEDHPLDVDASRDIVGWHRLMWTLHEGDADGRGAYLRSLSAAAVPSEGWAVGHATNYSPGTQLSGFQGTFSGGLVVLDAGGEVEHQRLAGVVPAATDDDGVPVVVKLDPAP